MLQLQITPAYIQHLAPEIIDKSCFPFAVGRHTLPIVSSHTVPAAQDMGTQAVMV